MPDREPCLPPPEHRRHLGMHWLEMRSFGSGSQGEIALQWNPGAQNWTHSGQHGLHGDRAIDTTGWRYLAHIPLPPLDAD